MVFHHPRNNPDEYIDSERRCEWPPNWTNYVIRSADASNVPVLTLFIDDQDNILSNTMHNENKPMQQENNNQRNNANNKIRRPRTRNVILP